MATSSDPAAFGMLISGLFDENNSLFPEEDVKDLKAGAELIPDDVTDARRMGLPVRFVQGCEKRYWHWVMPDGTVIYHGE